MTGCAGSAYWSRARLRCTRVTVGAMRNAELELRRVKRTSPSPRKTHMAASTMKRVQGDWSPWRSLGRPQCGFHISAPAYSPRKTWQNRWDCVKTHSAAQDSPVPRFRITNYAFRIPNFPADRYAPTHAPAGTITGQPQALRRRTIHYPMKQTYAPPRQRR